MSQTPSIYDLVADALKEMGIATAALARTLLLRNRHFVGHKYRFEGGYAVWLAEKNVMEVYDESGKVFTTVVVQREKAA